MLFLFALSPEDNDKFERIFLKYRKLMTFVANKILNDSSLAEDAVQDAFLSVSKNMEHVGGVEDSATKYYLTTIVKNKALDLWRKEKRRSEVFSDQLLSIASDSDSSEDNLSPVESPESSPGSSDPLEQLLEKETQELLISCIRKMDPRARLFLEYKYLHGLKEKEIAQAMGITPKEANNGIYSARKKLAKLLESEGFLDDKR